MNDKYRGYFVNLYLVNREYGGPEEGGWWYDCGEFLRLLGYTRNKEAAEKRAARISRVLDKWNKGRRPLWSVACTGIYRVRVEETPGEDFPTMRPHYE